MKLSKGAASGFGASFSIAAVSSLVLATPAHASGSLTPRIAVSTPRNAVPARYTVEKIYVAGSDSTAVDMNDSGQVLISDSTGVGIADHHTVKYLKLTTSNANYSRVNVWALDNHGVVYGDGSRGDSPDPSLHAWLRWSSLTSSPQAVCPSCDQDIVSNHFYGAVTNDLGDEVIVIGHNVDTHGTVITGNVVLPNAGLDGEPVFTGLANDRTLSGTMTRPFAPAGEASQKAFISRDGVVTVLMKPAGGADTSATAISPDGKIVVGGATVNGEAKVVRWDASGKVTILQDASKFVPVAVNNAGTIVGTVGWDGSAVVWTNGKLVNLTQLSHQPKGKTICKPTAINVSGQIAADICSPTTTAAVRLTPQS